MRILGLAPGVGLARGHKFSAFVAMAQTKNIIHETVFNSLVSSLTSGLFAQVSTNEDADSMEGALEGGMGKDGPNDNSIDCDDEEFEEIKAW